MFTNEERLLICNAVDVAKDKFDGVFPRAVNYVSSNPPPDLNLQGPLRTSTIRSIYEKKVEIQMACLTNAKGVRIRDHPTIRNAKRAKVKGLHPQWSRLGLKQPYQAENIFLGLTIGLFHKTKIDDFKRLGKVSCNEGQNADDRLTVFLCVNATGEDKRCVVSGKSVGNQVNYYSEPSAWMTSQILQCDLGKWNSQFQAENKKIVLFTSAPGLRSETNIEVIYHAELNQSNCVKISMIQCFKCLYRSDPKLQSLSNIESIDWVKFVDDAWRKVPPEVVKSFFHQTEVMADNGENSSTWSVEKWVTEKVAEESSVNLSETALSKIDHLNGIRIACRKSLMWKDYIEFDDGIATSHSSSNSPEMALMRTLSGTPSTSNSLPAPSASPNPPLKPWALIH